MKKNIVLKALVTLVLSANILIAQQSSIGGTFVHDFDKALDDGYSLVKNPLKFGAVDWRNTLSTVALTAALFSLDKNLKSFASANQTYSNNKIFQADRFWGNSYTALFAGGLYLTGLFAREESLRLLGLKASEAFVFSGVLTYLIKSVVGRLRPYAADSPFIFKPVKFFNNDYQSLPSGHATVAFAVSTVMANYSENILWKIFWFGTAGTVAVSRVYHQQHWLSDIFLGSAIGYFVGRFIVNLNNASSKTSDRNFTFYFSTKKIGLLISLK